MTSHHFSFKTSRSLICIEICTPDSISDISAFTRLSRAIVSWLNEENACPAPFTIADLAYTWSLRQSNGFEAHLHKVGILSFEFVSSIRTARVYQGDYNILTPIIQEVSNGA